MKLPNMVVFEQYVEACTKKCFFSMYLIKAHAASMETRSREKKKYIISHCTVNKITNRNYKVSSEVCKKTEHSIAAPSTAHWG